MRLPFQKTFEKLVHFDFELNIILIEAIQLQYNRRCIGVAKNTENSTTEQLPEELTKMLGAHVSQELYWQFKAAAASRNEQLKDAIAHAARMYIDAEPKKGVV